MKKITTILGVVLILSSMASADLSWDTFVIRNANDSPYNSPTITENPTEYPGWTLFGITEGGQKAGWATNYMNGMTIGEIASLSITRHETVDGYGPYFNIWITDGLGGYAVLANEPSHVAEYTAYGETAYDMTWDGALKNATSWVYEVSGTQGFKLPDDTTTYSSLGAGTLDPFHFEDFAGYTIATPSSHWGGTGAPDDLDAATYTAYGFNWVFGDTQDNYVEGLIPGGFLVKDPTLVAVPVPGAILLGILGLGAVGIKLRKFS